MVGTFQNVVEVIDEVEKFSRFAASGHDVSFRKSSGSDLENCSKKITSNVARRAFAALLQKSTLLDVKRVRLSTIVVAKVGKLAVANDRRIFVEPFEAAFASRSPTAGRQYVNKGLSGDQNVASFHRHFRVGQRPYSELV
jgi:hypothetical protein